MPTAGFANNPWVVSEAPHLSPSLNSDIGHSVAGRVEASITNCCARSCPRATDRAAPPSSWITSCSTRFPAAAIPCATSSRTTLSQPRLTSRTEARLGFLPRLTSVWLTRATSTGVWPQPC